MAHSHDITNCCCEHNINESDICENAITEANNFCGCNVKQSTNDFQKEEIIKFSNNSNQSDYYFIESANLYLNQFVSQSNLLVTPPSLSSNQSLYLINCNFRI